MKKLLWLTCLLLSLTHTSGVLATPIVYLISGEREPYIGAGLNNNGYAFDVVSEAFELAGYQVKLSYYPWNRAQLLTEQNKADAFFLIYHQAPSDQFVLSDGFKGGSLGLLTRLVEGNDGNIVQTINLSQLKQERIGAVIGGNYDFLADMDVTLEYARTDLQNLDKLFYGRNNYILIDKYTAVDLMVGLRPQYIGKLNFIEQPFAKEQFHLAFPRSSTRTATLLKAFNSGLALLKAQGRVQQLRNKHGLISIPPTEFEGTELNIAAVDNPDFRTLKDMGDMFERLYPNVRLRWHFLNERILRRRLMGDLAISDGIYDVVSVGSFEIPIWAQRQWIMPISDIPEAYDVDDLLTQVRKTLSYNHDLYGLPIYAESGLTFYRTDLFKSAGLTMPAHPTFEDIEHFAATLNDPDNKLYGLCLRGAPGWGGNMSLITGWVHAMGGRWFDENWQPQLLSKEWYLALSLYKRLARNYGQPNITNDGFNETLDLFALGHCAMWLDASVAANYLYNANYSTVADNIGFAPLPKDKLAVQWSWIWAMSIPKSSNKQEMAKAFILWATSKGYIKQVSQIRGWFDAPPGTRYSTYNNPNFQKQVPFGKFVLSALESDPDNERTILPVPYKGSNYVGVPEYSSFGEQVAELVAAMLNDKLSVEETMSRAQKIVSEQMVHAGYYTDGK